jgi:hypothetical protein
MAMDVRSRVRGFGIGLIVFAVVTLYSNPIRFHQTAHAGGLTMQVPSTWTPMKNIGNEFPVVLRREWTPFLPSGTITVLDRTESQTKNWSWTMEDTRKAMTHLYTSMSKDSHISNARGFDLKAGSRTAVCVEATINGSYHSLICTIVGTPLQFDFMGSRFAEPSAERMLASLN